MMFYFLSYRARKVSLDGWSVTFQLSPPFFSSPSQFFLIPSLLLFQSLSHAQTRWKLGSGRRQHSSVHQVQSCREKKRGEILYLSLCLCKEMDGACTEHLTRFHGSLWQDPCISPLRSWAEFPRNNSSYSCNHLFKFNWDGVDLLKVLISISLLNKNLIYTLLHFHPLPIVSLLTWLKALYIHFRTLIRLWIRFHGCNNNS